VVVRLGGMSRPTAVDRIHQTRRLLHTEGPAGVLGRMLDRASRRLSRAGPGLPVARHDLVRAGEIAASGWRLPPPLAVQSGEPLTVAWVAVPPGEGSGGHTTMFRLVASLERAGHRCILYLHDRHGWSLDQHRRTVQEWWPWLGAEVRDAADGIEDAHAVFATSWQTAYPVLASPAKGARFYLVQDFEPSFYPAGSEALLAEATYSFGFHGVTAGRWLTELLARDYRMRADYFAFGCDLDRYSVDRSPAVSRTGVCYFSRPSTPRRAFELGLVALDLLAARHPEVDIHLFGESAAGLPFAATDHGLLTPEELNRLYNRCIAGLVLSATNVSLVPLEMLAAGCIPVVNDAEHNRVVLDNPEVAYASPTPFDLADALARLVERPAPERRAAAVTAAASVRGASWADAGAAVERIVRRIVQRQGGGGAARPRASTGARDGQLPGKLDNLPLPQLEH
jgi:O-antigen biosynthesis protein